MTDEILNMRVLGELSEQLGHETAEMLLTRYEEEANSLMSLLNSNQGKNAPVEDLIKDIHKTAGSSAQRPVGDALQIKRDRSELKQQVLRRCGPKSTI